MGLLIRGSPRPTFSFLLRIVRALRFDVGLTHFLQWKNLLFIQHQRRANNPAEFFFVLLQRGANSFRYLGQLAFTF